MQKITLILLITFFINALHMTAQSQNQIEVFDIEKGMVIKTIPSNPILYKETATILKSIKDIYKKVNPIPKKGLMIKIPLNPMIHVQNNWMDSLIDEVIIFFPEDGEEPYIMTYDDENKYYFFTIHNSKSITDYILKLIGLSI